MPLLEIAISQPCSCFRNNTLAFKSETQFHNKLVINNGRRLRLTSPFSWDTFSILGKNYNLGRVKLWRRGQVTIKAVATLEIANVTRKNGVNGTQNVLSKDIDLVESISSQSSSEDSTEVDEREKLRRMRISKANKGNTPWNKGRKHTPETLQKIKERTRIAMQDPKVKMKLVNLGHAQTDETKIKIGLGVRLGWEKRRKKLKLQETCHYEWQNLIAIAARKGLFGEEELQWGSYKILNEKLEKEWLESIEQRKNTPRPKGSKRAPKSAEQKRKISAAIAAKWADPGYRDRVCSALAKFHGTPEGVEKKPRRKPSGDGQTRRSPKKKEEVDNLAKREAKSQTQRTRIKRSKTPLYKDPLASSKLEMLKSIRAQRAAAVNRKAEAITRAKLLIAEAEKAAEALEIAAQSSPIAQASLIESKMLIAEAIHFMESIENEEKEEDSLAFENDDHPLEISTDQELHLQNTQNLNVINHRKVNGVHSLSASGIKEEKQEDDDFGFNNFILSDFVKGNDSISFYNGILETEEELQQTSFISESNNTTNLNGIEEKPLVNGVLKEATNEEVKIIKKWVRGKLVEVEGES